MINPCIKVVIDHPAELHLGEHYKAVVDGKPKEIFIRGMVLISSTPPLQCWVEMQIWGTPDNRLQQTYVGRYQILQRNTKNKYFGYGWFKEGRLAISHDVMMEVGRKFSNTDPAEMLEGLVPLRQQAARA